MMGGNLTVRLSRKDCDQKQKDQMMSNYHWHCSGCSCC